MDSLKQYDTPKNQVDELKLSTKPKEKVVIWVEGNDWKLYGRFFKKDMVDQQGRTGGHSCHSAVDSYEEFKRQYPARLAIVIRDADYMRADGIPTDDRPDIFYADCHDHEMMCIYQDKVKEAVLGNLMVDDQKDVFFNKISEELFFLSFFQWYNYTNHSGYNFASVGTLIGFDYSFFKDPSKIEYEVHKRTTASRAKKGITEPLPHIDLNDYSAFIDSHSTQDRYEIINGHDFYNRINFYLQKIDNKKRSEDTLKEAIYAAFSFVFQNTLLYTRLNDWCIRNNTQILKAL